MNPFSLDAFAQQLGFLYQGLFYNASGMSAPLGEREEVGPGLEGWVESTVRGNPIVFACMALRLRVLSDIRFAFRELGDGTTGKLTGTLDGRNPASKGLKLLQTPWPGATTGELIARMVQDVDLTGNAFILRQQDRLLRLRPDWVTIVVGAQRENATPWDLDAELLGYLYRPGGPGANTKAIALLAEEVAHWAPQPDPLAARRGMSWLTPVLREILSDSAASLHKKKFFDNDATVNSVVEFDKETTKELYDIAKASFKEQHEGVAQAYKTLFLLGAHYNTIGTDFRQMDFKAIQGAGETRIAAAAGLNPVLPAFSEGLQGSTLNAGNFSSARRATADMTFRPLWRSLCGALAHIIEVPAGRELWYDDRDVMFLQEDRKDAAEIQLALANTIRQLTDAGYDPDSVVDAVMAEDMQLLKHMGVWSVQLQKPGDAKSVDMPMNGNGNGKVPASLPAGKG